MDKRLILSVLLVSLAWQFMTSCAQNTTAAQTNVTNSATNASPLASANNATSVAPAAGTATNPASASPAAGAATNAASASPAAGTATNAASASPAAGTATNAASAPPAAGTATNAASASPAAGASTNAASASPAAGAATNAASASPAAGASTNAASVSPAAGTATNATTVASATTNNVTTAAPATNATTAGAATVPVLAPLPLQASLSRQDCGSLKLCVAEPSLCDPTTGVNCNFLSAKQQSGQTYNFELEGQTQGYVAAGVSSTTTVTGTISAYICANFNGRVKFFSGTINNLVLNLTQTLNSSNVQGTVKSDRIQCTFTALLPDTATRAPGNSLSLSTGTYDASSGQLGTPSFRIITPVVNLSDPTVNVTNLLNNSNSTSSAYPVTHTQSFLPVMLVTVCMLAFTAV